MRSVHPRENKVAEAEDNTRERLLDQGERLFAEKGFSAVSVREITAAANCNLAAVNYHFGSKQRLYLAVFRERWAHRARRVRQHFSETLAGKPGRGLEDVIGAMANAFLEGPMSEPERRCHIQLMQREMSDPGDALSMVVEEVMRPYILEITDLVRPYLNGPVDERRLRLSVLSILGVILYFFLARPAVSRIVEQEYDSRFKPELVSHITAFSLHGIHSLNQE